jgi:hypothetical protein
MSADQERQKNLPLINADDTDQEGSPKLKEKP